MVNRRARPSRISELQPHTIRTPKKWGVPAFIAWKFPAIIEMHNRLIWLHRQCIDHWMWFYNHLIRQSAEPISLIGHIKCQAQISQNPTHAETHSYISVTYNRIEHLVILSQLVSMILLSSAAITVQRARGLDCLLSSN